ncbi:MAG: M20/M25/M40 family metallo-hydrolase [Parcubacteria group bacterium]
MSGIDQVIVDYTVEVYKRLHQIPEPHYETGKTRALIREEVEHHVLMCHTNGIRAKWSEYKGGIVVDLTPAAAEPERGILLLRADFDALVFKDRQGDPLNEATGVLWASQHPGLMHACFHDAHTAMLLGFLKLLADTRGMDQLKRCLRLVWQDAEENPITESGGAALVRTGVMEGVTEAYALHLHPRHPVGTLLSYPGEMLGNSGRLKTVFHGPTQAINPESLVRVVVKAAGGHVARIDSEGVNALRVAQQILNVFYARGFVSHLLNLGGGSASNIMPQEAKLELSVYEGVKISDLRKLANNVGGLYGANKVKTSLHKGSDNTRQTAPFAAVHLAMNLLADLPVRKLGPWEPATLEPCVVESGEPGEIECWWAIRNMLSPTERDTYTEQVIKTIKAATDVHPGTTVDFTPFNGHPTLTNSPESVAKIARLVQSAGMKWLESGRALGGEDFAHYLSTDGVEGAFIFNGCQKEGSGSFHTLTAQPHLDALKAGTTLLLSLAAAEN